jgi:hypothetical protein
VLLFGTTNSNDSDSSDDSESSKDSESSYDSESSEGEGSKAINCFIRKRSLLSCFNFKKVEFQKVPISDLSRIKPCTLETIDFDKDNRLK